LKRLVVASFAILARDRALFSRKDARLRADTHRQAKDAKEDITHLEEQAVWFWDSQIKDPSMRYVR